jgi:hypothetical protein
MGSIDAVLHFIMMSKFMHPEAFTEEGWKEIYTHIDTMPEVPREYYLALREVSRLFDIEGEELQ